MLVLHVLKIGGEMNLAGAHARKGFERFNCRSATGDVSPGKMNGESIVQHVWHKLRMVRFAGRLGLGGQRREFLDFGESFVVSLQVNKAADQIPH